MPSRASSGLSRMVLPPPIRYLSTPMPGRSEEHTSELQSQSNLVCRLLLEKKIHSRCAVAELLELSRGSYFVKWDAGTRISPRPRPSRLCIGLPRVAWRWSAVLHKGCIRGG